MTIDPRRCTVVGLGLALLGGLETVASLVLAGAFGLAVIALAATGSIALALSNVSERGRFDIEPTLAHRAATWAGAVFTLVAGIVMLGIGVLSAVTFA